jgi:tetratricopeptide (TPR) repeat protein
LKNIEDQERSIREFPDSSWSYLGLALALRVGLRHGWIDADERQTRQRMQDLARRAVEIDPNNFMAFHALGRVLMFNRDVDAATGAFRKGVELNPSSAIVADALAESLIFVGKTDEALGELERLERIDPLYGFGVRWTKGLALWQKGDCQAALDVFQSTPSMPLAANKMLTAIHHCLGHEAQAADAMASYLAANPGWTLTREREQNEGMWTAEGALDRWLLAMAAAGMAP